MSNTPPPGPTGKRSHWLLAGIMAAGAALVAACRSGPEPTPTPAPESRSPSVPDAPAVKGPVPAAAGSARASAAATPKAYRQDGATHLYGLNSERIFKGKLPPQLYAIGVLEVDIDRTGKVLRLNWLRAPRHALAIPDSAIVDDAGRAIAYVMIEGEAFERRPIRLGVRSNGWTEVLEGIAAGEHVVTRGAYEIKLQSAAGSVPAHGHVH